MDLCCLVLLLVFLCFISILDINIYVLLQVIAGSLPASSYEISDLSNNGQFYPYACINQRAAKNKIYESIYYDETFNHESPGNLTDCYEACSNSSLILFDAVVTNGKADH